MSHCAPPGSFRNRSASHSRLRRTIRRQPSRPHLCLERLEDRTMMTVQPLTLVDPSLLTRSEHGSSASCSRNDSRYLSGASGVANDRPARPEYVAGSISARTAHSIQRQVYVSTMSS